jgi:hypothetical protein
VAFLDITQAFDKVWHTGLLFKIIKPLPLAYFRTLESYLRERLLQVKFEDETTTTRKVEAGSPQGSVLEPVLYLIYITDLPTSDNKTTANFADDTAILSTPEEPAIASM